MGEKEVKELNRERLKEIGESPAYPVVTNGIVYHGMTIKNY